MFEFSSLGTTKKYTLYQSIRTKGFSILKTNETHKCQLMRHGKILLSPGKPTAPAE
jgi:hypothetical protein